MSDGPLLAIDTSTDWVGVAVGNPDNFQERTWYAGRNATGQVPPVIAEMLHERSLSVGDLRACVVAIGPGSFSGLRIGLSLAKGFAIALGTPLVGIPTLEITGRRAANPESSWAVIRAGRSRLVWAHGPDFATIQTGAFADLLLALTDTSGSTVVGELDDEQADTLIGMGITVPSGDQRRRNAGDLLQAGADRIALNTADDPIALSPIYLHPASQQH